MATEGATFAATSRAASRVTTRTRHRLGALAWYLILILCGIVFIFPFFWTVSTSLKQVSELYDFPPSLLPAAPQWVNYATVMQTVPFLLWVKNSATVVVLVTCGVVVTASVVAYSFARFTYRGRNFFFLVTLATLMLPA